DWRMRRGEIEGEGPYACSDSKCSCGSLGLIATAAGKVKKMVAARLQNKPMAQAIPNSLRVGLCAQPSEPNPAIAVRPARATGLITPVRSRATSWLRCQTNKT